MTLNASRGQHRKYRPYAFTEQGVAMLSSVLRSQRAIAVNIQIMRAFVRMRTLLSSNRELARRLGLGVRDLSKRTGPLSCILMKLAAVSPYYRYPHRQPGTIKDPCHECPSRTDPDREA